jgi:hypothetical protein
MFSMIRKRLTYANVTVTLALVFAMSGGAYAANKYLITSTKQIKPTILKTLQGKTGAAGPQGPAGPAGPQGPAGTPGTPGTKGETGPEGKQGPEGKEGKEGKQGAVGKEGKQGLEGKEGSPWVAGGTLPSGQTETGTWSYGAVGTGTGFIRMPISFPIRLTAKTEAHFMPLGSTSTEECPGTVENPQAKSGNLCIYAQEGKENFAAAGDPETNELINFAGKTGAVVLFFPVEEGENPEGVWAVTAP